MHYREAMILDWSDSKSITAAQIAEAMTDANNKDSVSITKKMKLLSQDRIDAIGKQFNIIVSKLAKKLERIDEVQKAASCLTFWFDLLGGALYGEDNMELEFSTITADTIITEGMMPKYIKTLEEACLVDQAISSTLTFFLLNHTLSGVRSHNNKRESETTNNPFLKFVPTHEKQQSDARAHLVDNLLENGFSNEDRAYRISATIVKLLSKHFKK